MHIHVCSNNNSNQRRDNEFEIQDMEGDGRAERMGVMEIQCFCLKFSKKTNLKKDVYFYRCSVGPRRWLVNKMLVEQV